MIVLGINGGVRLGYQDTSAALIVDGKVVAAVEEERLSRVKFAPGQISQRAVEEVLKIGGINILDVDYVASHGLTWGEEYSQVLQSYFKHTFGYCPRIERVHHHDAHAASSYYASGFEEAMVLSIDNSGDGISTQLAIGAKGSLEVQERIARPNSLGMFYSMMTQYCGFGRDSDEYKLMGLAAYGKPEYDLSDILKVDGDAYYFDSKYLKAVKPGASQPSRQQPMFSDELISRMGQEARSPYQPITGFYEDVAASAQHALDEALVHLVTRFHEKTGLRKLCLAGGVALNCVANQKLMNLPFIDDIFIQPASGDAGISLGAAYYVSAQIGDNPKPANHTYLGRGFTNSEIEDSLQLTGAKYMTIDNPSQTAANFILRGQVLGWFQGRSEYGPRALGNRSILANATMKGMNDKVNHKIKFREGFRPFCPSVIAHDGLNYFEGRMDSSPYMTITYGVNAKGRECLPATTHVDHTARIQTVTEKTNPLYFELLNCLKRDSGHGACINTSFNVKDEPMVYSPIDALRTFAGSGLDALIIGNYLLTKQ